MSYNNSSEMSNYVYTRNYKQARASNELVARNKERLKIMLPQCEHKNIDLYIDPGGNLSYNMLGQLTQDINKVLDKCKK